MKRATQRTRIRWLPAALVLAALLLALLPATPEGAFAGEPSAALDDELAQAHARLPAREWTAIRNVIDAQRKALRAGDAARAFSFAAPGIQERFHDAATFAEMVRQVMAVGVSEIGLYYPMRDDDMASFETIATQVIPELKREHAAAQ